MMTRLRPTHTYLPFKFYPVYFFPIRYNRTSQLGVKKKNGSGKKTVSRRKLQGDAIAGTHNKVTPEQSPGPVVQKLDSAIHRIIHYPLDNY